MMTNGMGNQFALDMQGLNQLKNASREDPSKGVRAAAEQFEALFVQMMMKSMRDAIPKSGMMDSSATDMYQSMMDQQWSQVIAGRGVGLADMLVAQLEGQGMVPPTAATAKPDNDNLFAGIPRGVPRVLDGGLQAPSARGAIDSSPATVPYEAARRQVPSHVQQFVDQLAEPAQAASRKTGLPAMLILAQAALETGWGQHEIATSDGRNSHNLFGIKAGSRWQGATTDVATHEYIGGQRTATTDAFRVYNSFEEAFTDYGRLITSNARYQAVVDAADAEQAAHALQQGGYATDPAYADKLIAVMATLSRAEQPAEPAVKPLIPGLTTDRLASVQNEPSVFLRY